VNVADPVRRFMTPSPHSIGLDQPLAEAAQRMREHRIRHMPVLEGGKLRGIVTERDIALVEALGDVDPKTVTVEEAMTPEPWSVSPDASLAEVVHTMAERKYGCAVIMEGEHVVGVLTTIDALRAFAEMGHADRTLSPGQVRQRILEEHRRVRGALEDVDRIAEALLAGDSHAAGSLRRRSEALYRTLCELIDLSSPRHLLQGDDVGAGVFEVPPNQGPTFGPVTAGVPDVELSDS